MDILYLLIPLSAVLVLAIVAVFGWAVHNGQFDELENEGRQLFAADDAMALDEGQAADRAQPEESPASRNERFTGGLA